MRLNYRMICTLLAARRCRNAGQSVKEIALSARVSTSTVYRWLRVTAK